MRGDQTVNIKFPGRYTVNSQSVITINSKKLKPGSVIFLNAKAYVSNANETYRLVLTPTINPGLLKAEYKNDDLNKMLD